MRRAPPPPTSPPRSSRSPSAPGRSRARRFPRAARPRTPKELRRGRQRRLAGNLGAVPLAVGGGHALVAREGGILNRRDQGRDVGLGLLPEGDRAVAQRRVGEGEGRHWRTVPFSTCRATT